VRPLDLLLWVIVPYVALTVFVLGHVWRYRHDRFGWTVVTTQLHEQRLLRVGGPLFHAGILLTLIGHVGGILIPKSWTGMIPEGLYQGVAVGAGGFAGGCAVAGLAILGYRRWRVGPIARTTTPADRIMYALLAVVITIGLGATVLGGGHDYRESVAPWFRSILLLRPRPDLMSDAPAGFRLHALVSWALLAVWPFTRLVHLFSAPIAYLTRPYVVYRSRDAGGRAPRSWAHPGGPE
jgi:nitrate reductase gamma subunit